MRDDRKEHRRLEYFGGPFDGCFTDIPGIAEVHSREMEDGRIAVYRVKRLPLTGVILKFEMIRAASN